MDNFKELAAWLRVRDTQGVGSVAFKKLINSCKSAEEALETLKAQGKILGSADKARFEIDKAQARGVKILLLCDNDYPAPLKELRDPPPALYVLGNIKTLSYQPMFAIVGSRNSSANSRNFTAAIARELCENNIMIVSGMARGIDASAHQGALDAYCGSGPTVAVLGTGVDVCYPYENQDLYRRIIAHGAVISEMPLGSAALGGSFPRRNRIIAGLSIGVLVSEATLQSGSLITADLARKQKKLLFAVPGSPTDARASGPNKLLREGAIMTESAADIIAEIKKTGCFELKNNLSADLLAKPLDNKPKTVDISNRPCNRIEEFISVSGTGIDEIIRISGLSASEVAQYILELELENRVIRLPGNRVALSGIK
ncbi:MAG: DNA-processing protein DprA [Alphaproteobacteria bacterium]|nr:DNA-processing protein DprA [Alphaproteobacteria bacterium]